MSRIFKARLGVVFVSAFAAIIISRADDTRACPPIPCETALCMYDPVIDVATCFNAVDPTAPCKCESSHRCTPWYLMVIASRNELVTAQEDGTPPPCPYDGPCYQCFQLDMEIPCSNVYKCLNEESLTNCNPSSSIQECAVEYAYTNYTASLELTGQICCYWIQ